MPRGVKNPVKTIENQIKEIDERIAAHQARIESLNEKRKDLLSSKEKAEMSALYQLIKQSGKSPNELLLQLAGEPL